MNTLPLVSIIIPTYNRAHLIGETLDSVLAQTYQNWECIVVDDGSTDNTAEVINSYLVKDSRFQYHQRPKNRLPGGNAARNYGFEISKGEFIQWFDDDDIMLSNFFSSRIALFADTICLIIGSGYIVDDALNIKKTIKLETPNNLYKEYALWRFEIYTKSVLFRKDFVENYRFDETLIRGQETDFFSRIFYDIGKKKYKILNEPLYLYRQHDGTKTEKSKKYKASIKLSIAKNHLRSLERAFELKDEVLVTYSYKKSLKLYYTAYNNSDKKTYLFILKYFKKLLVPTNYLLYIKIKYFVEIGKINKKLNKSLFNHLRYNLPKI